jgi:hypothetical protein
MERNGRNSDWELIGRVSVCRRTLLDRRRSSFCGKRLANMPSPGAHWELKLIRNDEPPDLDHERRRD